MNSIYEEEFNVALGKRLMLLRQSRKMSLDYLGARIGVCGQQIHKYESGENRLPPERLAACARIFGVPVNYFFGECGEAFERHFDKSVLNIAAEVNDLPPEVRQSIYTLSKVINRTCEKKQEPATGTAAQDEQRAA